MIEPTQADTYNTDLELDLTHTSEPNKIMINGKMYVQVPQQIDQSFSTKPKQYLIHGKLCVQTSIEAKHVSIHNRMINGALFIKIDYLDNSYLVHIGNINNFKFNYIDTNDNKNFNFDDQYNMYDKDKQSLDLINSQIQNISEDILIKFTNHIEIIPEKITTYILSKLNIYLEGYFKSNFNIENMFPKTKNNLFIMKLEKNTEYVISYLDKTISTNTNLVNSDDIDIKPIELYDIKQYPDCLSNMYYLPLD